MSRKKFNALKRKAKKPDSTDEVFSELYQLAIAEHVLAPEILDVLNQDPRWLATRGIDIIGRHVPMLAVPAMRMLRERSDKTPSPKGYGDMKSYSETALTGILDIASEVPGAAELGLELLSGVDSPYGKPYANGLIVTLCKRVPDMAEPAIAIFEKENTYDRAKVVREEAGPVARLASLTKLSDAFAKDYGIDKPKRAAALVMQIFAPHALIDAVRSESSTNSLVDILTRAAVAFPDIQLQKLGVAVSSARNFIVERNMAMK